MLFLFCSYGEVVEIPTNHYPLHHYPSTRKKVLKMLFLILLVNSVGIYLLKINNRNIKARCETCSKLTIKVPEWRQWCLSAIFIVNFEHISHLVLLFLLLTLNMKLPAENMSSFVFFLRQFKFCDYIYYLVIFKSIFDNE